MESQLFFIFIFAFMIIPTIFAQNSTTGSIVVDGNATIAETDENFICMTIDIYPFNECPTQPCIWDANASILNLNVSLPTLTKAVQAFKSLRIRIGGSLQDRLIYDVGEFKGNCPSFTRNGSLLFQVSEGCLPMERWDDLNNFFNQTGAIVTFGLNALLGKQHTVSSHWEGDWNYRNAEALIQYTVEKNYQINSWELGNELAGANSIGASVNVTQYAKDVMKLREIVDRLYNNSQQKPLIVAPGAFFDGSWFDEFVNKTGSGVVDVLTHHIYNMGAGKDPKIISNYVNPSHLSQELRVFQQLENIVQNHAPWSVAWVGEAGGAYHGGAPFISNAFIDGFWYLDQLGMAASTNTKVYCRQTLVGGHYGLLRPQTLAPTPDYYGALLFHRLMSPRVLKVHNNVSTFLRTYAHCSRGRTGVTMLFINLSNQTDFTIQIENQLNMSNPMRKVSRGGRKLLDLAPAQREEYHLTPSNGLVRSPTVLLNGNLLETTEEGDLPDLTPIFRDGNSSISIATWSIVYVVIPDFVAPACE